MKFTILKRLSKLVILCCVFYNCNDQNSNIETEIKVPVSVQPIQPETIETYIQTTGTVYPTQEVNLKTQLAGKYYLRSNPKTGESFALGDLVRKGQTLIRIEDPEFENNIQIESKKLNLEVSKNNLDKQKSLYDKGGVTLRELKNSEIEYINAKYAYDNAEIQLNKTTINSPFDGTIVSIPYYTPGIVVEQGQEVMKIMNYYHLLMDVKLSEKHLYEVKNGLTVRIINYANNRDTLFGKIAQISPVIDTETRTFKGVLEIENPQFSLRPGMFVKADILTMKRDSTIVIPKEVIMTRQSDKIVYIVENGIALERKITAGLENADYLEVTQGLKMNDRLVITGFETLRNNAQVSVIQ